MVLETVNENLCVNKLIATKKDIIMIEGDMIVPDSKPDILNTICTSGVVCIYKKEVLDEKVRIDGNVNTYIMYLADDTQDKVRGINTSLDFSETIPVPNSKEGMESVIQVKLKSIECKVINMEGSTAVVEEISADMTKVRVVASMFGRNTSIELDTKDVKKI